MVLMCHYPGVVHHVSLQLQLPLELLTAGVAVVLHLVTVNSLVINHVLLLSKALPTGITDPGFLSCVNPPMKLQLTLADEPPLTELADPGFDPGGMGLSLVCGHARLHGETLTTDITHVGPLSTMHPDKKREVNYQIFMGHQYHITSDVLSDWTSSQNLLHIDHTCKAWSEPPRELSCHWLC